MPRLSRLRFMNVDRTRMPRTPPHPVAGRPERAAGSSDRLHDLRAEAEEVVGGLLGQVSVAPVTGTRRTSSAR
ncbi:MAG: hypothetical protein R2734_20830 [Nocardioides sp.]